jgi:tetratricopeptide (TPR) repeat protein
VDAQSKDHAAAPGDVYKRYAEALRLGHQLAAQGRYRDALKHYEQAAGLAGERARPHIAVGDMLVRLGRARQALEAYERALAAEPANVDALTGQATALLALGRRAQAAEVTARLEALREPAQADTARPIEEAPLGGAEALHAGGERARRAGNRAAAIDAWLRESRAHRADLHFDAAIDACLRALSLSSGEPRVHLELADIYFRHGWRELAEERVRLLDLLLTTEDEPDPELRAEITRLAQSNELHLPQRA